MAEQDGGRDHIDRTADYLIKYAGYSPPVAKKIATDTRIRVEKRQALG